MISCRNHDATDCALVYVSVACSSTYMSFKHFDPVQMMDSAKELSKSVPWTYANISPEIMTYLRYIFSNCCKFPANTELLFCATILAVVDVLLRGV